LSGKRRNIWVAVLAGGDGQRLSALTHNAQGIYTPKQYCSLTGGQPLLQLSLQRALAVAARDYIPSDHYVEHEDLLAEFLRQTTAPEALDSDKLTLLGMTPNAPDSGFGYLSPAPDSGVGLRPVHQFIEKPDEARAAKLIRAGSVWNSGIFAGRISQIVGDRSHAARPHSGELEDWLACSRTN
jgi:mannose-1-phosphate guanylyltransferase